jgi:two-component system response regulator AtoC
MPRTRDLSATLPSGESGEPQEHGFSILVSCASGVSAVRLPDAPEIVLGRTDEADVVVSDPSVSRRHALLRLGDSMTLEDLNSRNGTRVLGVPLRAGERASVAVGTVIELGSSTLVLERARTVIDVAQAPVSIDPARLDDARGPCVDDPTMKRLFALLDIIAPTQLPVLIMGETGVGKEIFAEALHARSTRPGGPLLRLNCAALPESVLEGELFGYERGAFTGAAQARVGLFEAADGGTVFLDEVGELPLATQAKLLRVLENGEVLRIGGREAIKIDVRFVSATNQDLRYLVAERTFRPDLFFRLNGMSVTLPPLRKRIADIRTLAARFLAAAAERAGRRTVQLTEAAARALERYAWPGNVRELKMVM